MISNVYTIRIKIYQKISGPLVRPGPEAPGRPGPRAAPGRRWADTFRIFCYGFDIGYNSDVFYIVLAVVVYASE